MRLATFTHTVCSLAVLSLCAGCDSCQEQPAPKPQPSASASASAAPVESKPPERHGLVPRIPVKVAEAKRARQPVLEALDKAAELSEQKQFADALSALAGVRQADPTGAALAVELARAAQAAGDEAQARRWAAEVLAEPLSSPAAAKAAAKVLGDAAVPSPARPTEPKSGPYPSLDAACAAIVAALRGDGGPARSPYLGDVADVVCEPEPALELGAEGVISASPLRVSIRGQSATQVLAWVAIQKSETEVLLHGPVESIVAPSSYGLTNDFAIALERAEVLPGGAPEIVVRLTERFTVADLGLNEVGKLDQTRVVILTLDREGVVESVGFMLDQTLVRDTLDPEDEKLPVGWSSSKPLGKPQEFKVKVQWAIPNGIELTKDSGNVKPPFEGKLTLFPEAPAAEAGGQ